MSDRRGPEPEGTGRAAEPSGSDDHLTDLPDGIGCAEIWEHLSDRRTTDEE